MNDMEVFVRRVAVHFQAQLGESLLEVYKLGSLAHGGFSRIYSDIDIGILMSCPQPPPEMDRKISEAKIFHWDFGKKLSVFWANPDFTWGRLPVMDRLDLLDHGVPLLGNYKAEFARPTKAEIHRGLRDSLEKSYLSRLPELSVLNALPVEKRKPYIRSILYPARLIYTWDNLAVDSNDRAVDYLHRVQPSGLDLKPIDMALACRREECSADEVFALGTDLDRQFEACLLYISTNDE